MTNHIHTDTTRSATNDTDALMSVIDPRAHTRVRRFIHRKISAVLASAAGYFSLLRVDADGEVQVGRIDSRLAATAGEPLSCAALLMWLFDQIAVLTGSAPTGTAIKLRLRSWLDSGTPHGSVTFTVRGAGTASTAAITGAARFSGPTEQPRPPGENLDPRAATGSHSEPAAQASENPRSGELPTSSQVPDPLALPSVLVEPVCPKCAILQDRLDQEHRAVDRLELKTRSQDDLLVRRDDEVRDLRASLQDERAVRHAAELALASARTEIGQIRAENTAARQRRDQLLDQRREDRDEKRRMQNALAQAEAARDRLRASYKDVRARLKRAEKTATRRARERDSLAAENEEMSEVTHEALKEAATARGFDLAELLEEDDD